jgi:hypothetical protein
MVGGLDDELRVLLQVESTVLENMTRRLKVA